MKLESKDEINLEKILFLCMHGAFLKVQHEF